MNPGKRQIARAFMRGQIYPGLPPTRLRQVVIHTQ